MALADRKSADIFNKRTGGDRDAKSIDTSKETEIRDKFNNGDHITDQGMFENLAPALYAVQQITEDIEELRRFVTADINSISTSQANAITANSAKTGITTTQANAITANTAKRDARYIYIPIVCNFYGDLSTGEFHVSFSDGETESSATTNRRNQFVAPCDGHFHKVIVRSNNSTLERGAAKDLTIKSKKVVGGTASVTTLETKVVDTVAAETKMLATFDSTNSAFDEGDRLLLSMQLSEGFPRGNKSFFVTVVFKIDQADLD